MTRAVNALCAGSLIVLALTACTGDEKPPKPTNSASTASGAGGATNDAVALAKDIIGSGTAGAKEPVAKATYPESTLEVGVESLTADATSTVLTLVARDPGAGVIAESFGVEDNAAWQDLHQLSLQDGAAKVRYYPYRYAFLPDSVKFGSLSADEHAVRSETWQPFGVLIFPPMTGASTVVDVNLPRGLNDSAGLGTMPVATIKNVQVTR